MTTPMPELKPCPFCADPAPGHYEHSGEYEVVRYVVCNTCGATCSDPDTLPEKNAYNAWNTRAEQGKRQPLTGEQLRDVARAFKGNTQQRLRDHRDEVEAFVREVEAAHGITATPQGQAMTACIECPFREVGGLPYTDEGHAALEDGHQPACHMHTPHGMQFDNPFPSEEIECKGYHLYRACETGFAIPKREPATPQGKI